jgi:ferredoxin-NADP reductase
MTEMSKSSRPWDGQTSLIDGALVKKLCGDLPAPIYYLAGPSAMLDALRETLIGTSINDDDIRSDEFYGY